MSTNQSGISVIVPVFNEEETIPIFCDTMDKYVLHLSFEIELIFVNDGSVDKSLDILKMYQFKNIKRVKIINLSKNFGFHAAARAGIKNATYDFCTWFGVDLQEPLEILPISYEKLVEERYEVVYFEKRTVKVSKLNRMFSKVYSYLMKRYAVKTYSSDGTATIAFGPKIKRFLNDNIEANSSLMLQIMDAGFIFDTIPLDYNERTAGESKWTFAKKVKLFIDSFVSFSFMPIRLVSIIGIVIFFIGVIMGLFIIVNKIVNPTVPLGYSTIASILALGFGVTNISLGIIAEYLWRTYDASMNRPVYIISDIYELNTESNQRA